ncbi:MAG: hypothetical protein K9G03_02920 [Pontimonas sp.]|nr:hypothetical protein [Pontimonas sp.]
MLMPVATLRNIVSIAHNPVLLPRDKVINAGLNGEVAARAGVDLLSFGSTNRLHCVGVPAFGFTTSKAGSQSFNIQRLALVTPGAPTPVIAGHA